MNAGHFQIRDPIHGVIFISPGERAVIDSMVFQRLRNIKQVGFADFAFPCATHSRYSHSLGAMCVAGKIFERVIAKDRMMFHEWERLRQTVRLAALLHDLGHAPLSHTTEMLMPKARELWPDTESEGLATHEDFTLKLIEDSSFSKVLEENFIDLGVTPRMVASLLKKSGADNLFIIKGLDYAPILRQIISSEVDADRMDYLLRDSFFCGVNYGKFDSDWLMDNLVSVEKDNQLFLGLKSRAIFAFEDFLLSRYHMFASVYFHHTPVVMERMLERFFQECNNAFVLPSDVEEYIKLDDLDLWQALRSSNNRWAMRIVRRNPYVMLDEHLHGQQEDPELEKRWQTVIKALAEHSIDTISSHSKSVLSTYFGKRKSPLFVEDARGKLTPLEEFSQLFVRYQFPARLLRIYVDAKDKERAEKILQDMSPRP